VGYSIQGGPLLGDCQGISSANQRESALDNNGGKRIETDRLAGYGAGKRRTQKEHYCYWRFKNYTQGRTIREGEKNNEESGKRMVPEPRIPKTKIA